MAGETKPEKAPPAPPEAAGSGEVPLGFEGPSLVMDQDELDAKVTVNVETVFSEIFIVKILGAVFMVLAGVLAFLPAILAGEEIVTVLPSIILAVVGIVFGIMGFFVRKLRKWMLYLAPGVLIAAVAVRPPTSSIGSLDMGEIGLGLAFAIFWFLGVEYLHSLSRFVEVGEMAIKRRLTNFNLSGVVKHFLAYGFLMLGIVLLVTLGVVGLVPLMKKATLAILTFGGIIIALGVIGSLFIIMQKDYMKGILYAVVIVGFGAALVVVRFFVTDSDLFAKSAELNSVFGIGIASAVLFTILGLVLTVYYSTAESVAKVEKVEYSREKLKEMLASGQVLDFEQDTGTLPGGGNPP